MIWAALGCYWLAGILNPAFAAMVFFPVLMIPVIIIDTLQRQQKNQQAAAAITDTEKTGEMAYQTQEPTSTA